MAVRLTAALKTLAQDPLFKKVLDGAQAPQATRLGGGRFVHALAEHLGCPRQRGELQLLLGAEATDKAALAHLELLGQPAEGQALEADDRGELDRRPERLGTGVGDLGGGATSHD